MNLNGMSYKWDKRKKKKSMQIGIQKTGKKKHRRQG